MILISPHDIDIFHKHAHCLIVNPPSLAKGGGGGGGRCNSVAVWYLFMWANSITIVSHVSAHGRLRLLVTAKYYTCQIR